MNTTRIAILSTLRQDLLIFLEELSGILPENKDLILMRSFAKIVIIADVMEYIIKNLVPLEDKMLNREEDYFIENAVMFERLQNYSSNVNYFRETWINTDDPHNKEAVWAWMDHFIQLAKSYRDLM